MQPDKPVRARNVPTDTVSELSRGQVSREQVDQATGKPTPPRASPAQPRDAERLAAEARLQAKAESRPVPGTASQPYVDEPGKQLRSRTKVADPADSAMQPRSAPPAGGRSPRRQE